MENKLPEGWTIKPLGEVSEFLDNKRIPISDPERKKRLENAKEKYPYYGANGQVGWIDSYIFDEPLILLAEDGGNFGSVIRPIAYRIFGKTWVNNHAHVIKPKEGISFDWLYYQLMFKDVTDYISGTTRAKLNQGTAKKIPIIVPPLPIQEVLVKKLDAFFKEYDILKSEKDKAKQNHDKILQSAVMKIFFPEKFEEGWKLENLNDEAEIIMGQSPPSSTYNTNKEGLPFFQGKKEFGAKHPIAVKYCSDPKKIAEANDTLLSVRAPVGPVNMATEKCCIGRGLAAIRSKGKLDPDYIYYFMKGNEYNIAFSGRGSTFDAISGRDIKSIKIPVPPTKEIQKEILKKLKSILDFQESILEKRTKIKQDINLLPHSVLTKAFQGELIA